MSPGTKKTSVSILTLGIFYLSVLIISPHYSESAQAAPAKNSNSNSISRSSSTEISNENSTEGNSNSKWENGEERGGYFEGDMILPNFQSKRTGNKTRWPRSGKRDRSYRWPNAVVTYELDFAFSRREVNVILGAMKEISAKSCVQFRLTTDKRDSARVRIVLGQPGSDCFSRVGFWNEVQELSLERESPTSPGSCIEHDTVLHELLHTLGFHHEQSRTDRDKWITINTDNIEPQDYKHNFKKYNKYTVTDFNIPYDYNSIMHYEANAFAIDPSIPTIIPKVPNVKVGPGQKLTQLDAMKINAMYSRSNPRCQRQLESLTSEMPKKSKLREAVPENRSPAKALGPNAKTTLPRYKFTKLTFQPNQPRVPRKILI